MAYLLLLLFKGGSRRWRSRCTKGRFRNKKVYNFEKVIDCFASSYVQLLQLYQSEKVANRIKLLRWWDASHVIVINKYELISGIFSHATWNLIPKIVLTNAVCARGGLKRLRLYKIMLTHILEPNLTNVNFVSPHSRLLVWICNNFSLNIFIIMNSYFFIEGNLKIYIDLENRWAG